MNKKYKEVPEDKKVSLGIYSAEIVNAVNRYVSLLGIKRTEFISNLILKELEDKILTNDFIELPVNYYFNLQELKEEGTVKASKVRPVNNTKEIISIKGVPNNLDSFNRTFRSYCYGTEKTFHRGLFIYYEMELAKVEKLFTPEIIFNNEVIVPEDVKEDYLQVINLEAYYLIFSYDSLAEEIEISVINPEEVEVNIEDPILNKDVLDYVQQEEEFISNPNESEIGILKRLLISKRFFRNYYSDKLIANRLKTNPSSMLKAMNDYNIWLERLEELESEYIVTNEKFNINSNEDS